MWNQWNLIQGYKNWDPGKEKTQVFHHSSHLWVSACKSFKLDPSFTEFLYSEYSNMSCDAVFAAHSFLPSSYFSFPMTGSSSTSAFSPHYAVTPERPSPRSVEPKSSVPRISRPNRSTDIHGMTDAPPSYEAIYGSDKGRKRQGSFESFKSGLRKLALYEGRSQDERSRSVATFKSGINLRRIFRK